MRVTYLAHLILLDIVNYIVNEVPHYAVVSNRFTTESCAV